MNYRRKYLKLTTISLISTLVSILLTISIPFNSVKANVTNEKLQQSLVLQNNPQVALEVSEQGRTRELVASLAQRSPTSLVQTLSIEQIQAVAKQQNATLVQYSIINDEFKIAGQQQTKESELYIWVIKPTGEVAFRSVDLKPLWQKKHTSLADLVSTVRQPFGIKTSGTKGIMTEPILTETNSNQELEKLNQLLIQPIAEFLPNQPDDRVIFVPQGDLFFVPFAALKNAQGNYLIEQHTIATAPSIQVLSLLEQRQQQIQGIAKDILVVGNPTMPKMPSDLGGRRLSPLPGAEAEAKNIASIFNTQALVGDAATETAVVQRMPQARIIHIATNTILGSNNQLKLALAPSSQDDGWLTSKEIINLNLKAELVVMSACDTALGKITGDGVIGLSRSVFTAGVPTVIGALWEIDDVSTTFLMTEFYQNFSENPDKATAFRHAMLTTMKKYPNPRYWPAFTLIGAL